MPGWNILIEPTGHFLDLCDEAPTAIGRAATEAFAQWSAVNSSIARKIGGPPAHDALYDVIKAKGAIPQAGGTIRYLAEEWWIT